MINILFIDNFDSFTYNLVDEFEKRNCKVMVYRNNIPMKEIDNVIESFKPNLIVISPGPSTPKEAGNCVSMIKKYCKSIPIFGVCLGHQCIVEAFGGKVDKAPCVVHGKSSFVSHNGEGIFKGLDNPLHVGRYHSLCGVKMPKSLDINASFEKIVMGVKHKEYPVYGVQFHPESILTPAGGKIIKNIIEMVK